MPSIIAPELAELARRAREGGLDLSAVSLRVQADLLMGMAEPPAEDLAVFEEMALALLPEVDVDTATILARKLGGWQHASPLVIAQLRAFGGPVLAALIEQRLPLDGDEFDGLASDGPDNVAVALASRSDLPASIATVLAGRNERAVDLALAANHAVALPAAAVDLLLARAADDPAYASLLLMRPDLAGAELVPLFLVAGPERRRAMLDSLRMLEALDPSRGRPPLQVDDLSTLMTLAATDADGALAALADRLNGGPALASALKQDAGRELTAIALTAGGASPEDATRFLIRLGDDAARSVTRIFGVVALMRSLSRPVAARLLDQIARIGREPDRARNGRLVPAMDPSASPVRVGQGRRDERGVLHQVRKGLGLRG